MSIFKFLRKFILNRTLTSNREEVLFTISEDVLVERRMTSVLIKMEDTLNKMLLNNGGLSMKETLRHVEKS